MHLARQAREGGALTNSFARLDTADNIERLRGIPIFIFVGGDNVAMSKEGAQRSFDRLCDEFGSHHTDGTPKYRFRVIPGYGHHDCWIGRDAHKDVYPLVLEEVERVWGVGPVEARSDIGKVLVSW